METPHHNMPLGKFTKMVLIFALKVKPSSPKHGKKTDRPTVYPSWQPTAAIRPLKRKKGGRISPTAPQRKNCHSILNIFFWSSHNVGNDCLSFSVLMLLLIFPARTAWMISGASSVNRIIRDTYASPFSIALASSWTLENLPLSIKACQRNALARLVMIGSLKLLFNSCVTMRFLPAQFQWHRNCNFHIAVFKNFNFIHFSIPPSRILLRWF